MASLKEELPDADVRPIPMSAYREVAGAALRWALRLRADPRLYFFITAEYQNANWDRLSDQVKDI